MKRVIDYLYSLRCKPSVDSLDLNLELVKSFNSKRVSWDSLESILNLKLKLHHLDDWIGEYKEFGIEKKTTLESFLRLRRYGLLKRIRANYLRLAAYSDVYDEPMINEKQLSRLSKLDRALYMNYLRNFRKFKK